MNSSGSLASFRKCDVVQLVGWAASFLIFFGLHIHYLEQAASRVPYMDSVRLIWQLHDFLTGAMSLPDLWRQSGSVGLLFQLGTMFEWIFWGLDTRLTVFLTAGVWALLFVLYVRAWPNCCEQYSLVESNGNRLVGFAAIQMLLGFYFFSPAGWEIWLLDLGFPQTLKNLIIAAYIYALSCINYQENTYRRLFLSGAMGALIILLVAYNWSYSLTVAAIFVVVSCGGLIHRNAYKGLLIIVPILTAQLIYVRVSGGALNSMAVKSDSQGLVNFFKAVLYGASSIFAGNETLSELGISGVLLMTFSAFFIIAVLATYYYWLIFLRTQRNAIFFVALGVFGFCTLGSIALARGGQGYQFAAASRYFMDYQFILVSFLGVTSCLLYLGKDLGGMSIVGIRVANRTCVRSVLVVFGVLAIAGQGATYLGEYKKAPYRALIYQAQSSVYLSGEANEKNATLLQTELASLTRAMAISDQYQLASLRNFSGKCRLNEALASGDVYDSEESGRWLGRKGMLILGACPAVIRVHGFLPDNVVSRTLSISLDGEEYRTELVPGHDFSIAVKHDTTRNIARLKFAVDQTHTPSAMGHSDTRELGAFITRIGP